MIKDLHYSVYRDAMTGLHNRKFLEEETSKLVSKALRDKEKIGLIMVDMDHFKLVNDTYGHDMGDFILKELSFILQKALSPYHLMA